MGRWNAPTATIINMLQPWPQYIIHDISRKIVQGMPVYPNNPEVVIQELKGETSTVSRILLGSHTGTHLDAPKHVFDTGIGVEDIALSTLIGSCKVLDFSDRTGAIKKEDLQLHSIHSGDRILVKTSNSLDPFVTFNPDYVYLDGDAADFLAELDIALFGIDYLSVKQYQGRDFRPHDSLLIKNIVILEGLNLAEVIEGTYVLVALPLPVGSLDGAPIRAILLE